MIVKFIRIISCLILLYNPSFAANEPSKNNQNKSDVFFYLKNKYPEIGPKVLGHPVNIKFINEKRHVSLTFDDGPNPKTTPHILKILKKNNMKATFFLLGKNVIKHPKLTRQIARDGHDLGNHSFSHAKLVSLQKQQVEKEIVDTQKAVYQITGKKPNLFRPPYGTINDTVISIAHKKNLRIILWSVDPKEYENHVTEEQIMNTIKSTIKPNSIILSHDTKRTTVEMLPDLIKFLTQNQYTVVPVSAAIQ